MKYLYGAAVQGIQNFIFQTNKLQEIVGASELVEEICTKKFFEILKDSYSKDKSGLIDDGNAIIHAAGNVKYIFDDEDSCKKIVREFPKIISEFAPGITISQAVVKFENDDFEKAVNELEMKLRVQRNKPLRSATLGLMGILRSRQTGLPVICRNNDGEYLDAGTMSKLYDDKYCQRRRSTKTLCKKMFGEKVLDEKIAYNIEDITKNNDWIAIIHADGNGLGQIVQKIGTNKERFKKFSEKLDEATIKSAMNAYIALKDKFHLDEEKIIPVRPIVLGGDDLTLICRADLAMDFTSKFLEEFESNTRIILDGFLTEVFEDENVKRLTACAGISYIKSSFPFYYGYNLAEALCSKAKKDAKNEDAVKDGRKLPQSCLMFHKVQDSFTENYDEISERELQIDENISFEFGPYYLFEKENRWTIENLMNKAKTLKNDIEGNAIKSHLRQWMSLLHDNKDMAKQKLNRLLTITKNKSFVEEVTDEQNNRIRRGNKTVYPVYDILAIHTINNQITK